MKLSRNVQEKCQEQTEMCNSVPVPLLGKRLIQKTGSVAYSIENERWMEDTCLLLPFMALVRADSQAYEVLCVNE